jgi:hypothetical protein
MKRLFACLLLFGGLLLGTVAPAHAQRGYYRRGPVVRPRYYRPPAYRPYYGPRYYHATPYRSYYGRQYYRPRPYPGRRGYYSRPGVLIRP